MNPPLESGCKRPQISTTRAAGTFPSSGCPSLPPAGLHAQLFFFFLVILENLSCSQVRGCPPPCRVAARDTAAGPLAERMNEKEAKSAHPFQGSILGAFLPQSLYQGCPPLPPPNRQLLCFSPPLPPTPQVCPYGSGSADPWQGCHPPRHNICNLNASSPGLMELVWG